MLGWIVTWHRLGLAYYTPFPVGFFVTSLAFAGYAGSHLIRFARRRGVSRNLTARGFMS
jgi:zinc/manganese transport system permease protein